MQPAATMIRWLVPVAMIAVLLTGGLHAAEKAEPPEAPALAGSRDAASQETKLEPRWKSSDPAVVQVSPAQGRQVEITAPRKARAT